MCSPCEPGLLLHVRSRSPRGPWVAPIEGPRRPCRRDWHSLRRWRDPDCRWAQAQGSHCPACPTPLLEQRGPTIDRPPSHQSPSRQRQLRDRTLGPVEGPSHLARTSPVSPARQIPRQANPTRRIQRRRPRAARCFWRVAVCDTMSHSFLFHAAAGLGSLESESWQEARGLAVDVL